MRRVGRERCGDATSTVATATESRTMGKRGAPVRSKVTWNACQSPSSCTRNAMRRPSTHADDAGDGEVAGQAPPAQEEHGHHQQAHRPQRRQLVEDQEERARAVRDRVEEPDDRFLGRGRVVRVQDQRHEEQRGDHRTGGVTRSASRRALGALARRDLAEVGPAATGPCPSPTLPRATGSVTVRSSHRSVARWRAAR